MEWTQVIDPLGNLAGSMLVAIIPILLIFYSLIVRKMKIHNVGLLAVLSALVLVVVIYKMPVKLALFSVADGALYGLFPICWIIISALFLFNCTVESGSFEIIKKSVASVTPDGRLQTLIIAFSFGAFLEGVAGFGVPVALTAAMLVSLGMNPLHAAGMCLIANTAPVAFGSIGIPITVASQVTSISELTLSQMVGRTLPLISLIIPFYLIILLCGFKKAWEIWPAMLVSGVSFAVIQFVSSNLLGPSLPDILAGAGSLLITALFLKYWKPKKVWDFSSDNGTTETKENHYSGGELLKAWSPFILLSVMVIAWGIPSIKKVLDHYGQIVFEFPVLHNAITDLNGNRVPHLFRLNFLSAAGTAVLISALISIPLIGLNFKRARRILLMTLDQLKYAIVTIAAILGFAYLMNDSGMIQTMAAGLANTGKFFPFFAPVLGWLGVFITGSDTSSNALFSRLQAATASSIGVDPVVTVSANISGGVIGKMISPSSIAVAAAAGNLVGKESELFKYTFKHSFILLFVMCVVVTAQAYLIHWIVPEKLSVAAAENSGNAGISAGYLYITVFAFLLAVFSFIVYRIGRKDKDMLKVK